MTPIRSAKHFHNEVAAYEYIEACIWAKGRSCPHCGAVGRCYKMEEKHPRRRLQVLRLPQAVQR